ncbi:MAG: AmmeMemoRadiSam system protein B [Brevinematia bacterium]
MLDNDRNCRKPSYSGSFYPSEKFELEKMITSLIEKSDVPEHILKSDILAVVVPHAGYRYSGKIAAYSYKSLINKHYDVAIILAPSHHFYLNFFITDDRDYYQTPLGIIKLNKEIIDYLRNKKEFEISHKVQDEEHSLEVQLPFLYQVFKGKIEIVPILYGEENRLFMIRMSEILEEVMEKFNDKKILIIVSTDLSHYHPYKEAYEIDTQLSKLVLERDFENYVKLLYSKEIEACGAGPLGTFIFFASKNQKKVEILKLLNSGDTSGTKDFVVGYMSAVMY